MVTQDATEYLKNLQQFSDYIGCERTTNEAFLFQLPTLQAIRYRV